jgi:alkylhydroperoxidase family enzyme
MAAVVPTSLSDRARSIENIPREGICLMCHRIAAAVVTMACIALSSAVRPAEAADAHAPGAPRVPLLDNPAAWEKLPECDAAREGPLPNWARALAGPLPATTACILELDGTYRLSTELDPKLRAKMRWVAARGTRCNYGQGYALADLRRAGATEDEISQLRGDWSALSSAERAALEFAHKMTVAAYSVTDEEVAALNRDYGERAVVAMVLQLAYSNFLDRLVLALGVPVEEGGPLPPQRYGFQRLSKPEDIAAASRPEFTALEDDGSLDLAAAFGPDWTSVPFEDLKQAMVDQQERAPRVSVPTWETVLERLPEGMYPKDRPMKIKWSLVVLGHQPELGPTWLRCLRVFGAESKFDRVFAESIFWVVTRSLQCFY